jgi:predicted TIM-barrel fold metal-dependent hydrolase
MIIDAHVHVVPPRVQRNVAATASTDAWFAACHAGGRRMATVASLLAAMDAGGIDRAVCFTWPFADHALCAEANDFLAAAVHAHPGRLIGFGIVQPRHPGAAREVIRCARMGLRGIGEMNADAQGWALEDDERLGPIVAASIEADLPWTLHCSEPVGHRYAGKGTATPSRVAAFAERHEGLRLIGAHLGGGLPFFAHMPEIRRLCGRLWFDTAAVPHLYDPTAYRMVLDLCGPDRLLLGTDHPLLGITPYLRGLDAAGLTEAERAAVLGGTAASLFA